MTERADVGIYLMQEAMMHGPSNMAAQDRNLLFTCEVVCSDPRLSGTQTIRFSIRHASGSATSASGVAGFTATP